MSDISTTLKAIGIASPLKKVLTLCDGAPLLAVSATSDDAIDVWLTLREAHDRLQHWPVILGGPGELDFHKETQEFLAQNYKESKDKPLGKSGVEWFEYRRSAEYWSDRMAPMVANLKSKGAEIPNFMLEKKEPIVRKAPGLPSEDYSPNDEFIAHSRDEFEGDVSIALLPITHGWEAAPLLNFGSWNNCPEPAVHAAVHQYWFEQYGAEVVTITHDTIEMRVSRPPLLWDQAFALAEDQELYAEFDQMGGGLNTTRGLAASLLESTVWHFWWD